MPENRQRHPGRVVQTGKQGITINLGLVIEPLLFRSEGKDVIQHPQPGLFGLVCNFQRLIRFMKVEIDGRKVVETCRGGWTIGTKNLFINVQCLLTQRRGLGVVAHLHIDSRQVIQA